MANVIAKASAAWMTDSTWCQSEAGASAEQTTKSTGQNTTLLYSTGVSPAFTCTNLDVLIGVLMYCKRLNTTGTVTVGLSDDGGATYTREVTVNASDLPANASWVLFLFSSSLNADGGNDYKLAVKASSAGNATFYRDATTSNWARLILLNADYGEPAAGDAVYIVGTTAAATTVTMDNVAATDHGPVEIGYNGVLTFGTTAATNYYLKLSGHLTVWPGGTLSLGISGARIPSDSSAIIDFDSASQAQYGLYIYGAFNAYGATRSYVSAKLAADVSVNGTSLTTDVSTAWVSGDDIVLPSSSATYTEHEKGDLNGDAVGTTLTVHGFGGAGGGVAYAHHGTAPYLCEVLLLSRNVKIRGASAANTSFIGAYTGAAVNMSYVESYWLGGGTGDIQRGVHMPSGVTGGIQYCSFYGFIAAFLVYFDIPVFSYNIVYFAGLNNTYICAYASSAASVNTYNFYIAARNLQVSALAGNWSHNTGASLRQVINTGVWVPATLTYSYNVIHSSESGWDCAWTESSMYGGTITGLNCWRNSFNISRGLRRFLFVDCTFQTLYTQDQVWRDVIFRNCVWEADPVYTAAIGILINNACVLTKVRFENCTSGVITQYSSRDFSIYCWTLVNDAVFDNCKLNSVVPVLEQTGGSGGGPSDFYRPDAELYSEIHFARWGKVNGQHRTYRRMGSLVTDAVIFDVSGVSERLTPKTDLGSAPAPAGTKLKSAFMRKKVASGATATFTVRVRKSSVGDAGGADYTGAQPRLMLRANLASGLVAYVDTLLDTAASAVGSWETLTGASSAVSDDAVLEAYVDCDGSVGWVNVQNWS
jgi:hypothetical protein